MTSADQPTAQAGTAAATTKTAPAEGIITVNGLSKINGGRKVLDGLSFAVPEGEVFGFVGSNGSGKTTAIRILATLVTPDEGTATIAGLSVTEDPVGVRRQMGYLPEIFGVYPHLTCQEYLEFYADVHGLSSVRRVAVAGELLELVGLASRRNDDVDRLSRGEQQRLCLARAMVHDPSVLLLDEPTSGLDPRGQLEVRALINELRGMGKTVLVSSHRLSELEEMATWVGLVEKGRMMAIGAIGDLRDRALQGRRLRIDVVDAAPAATEAPGAAGTAEAGTADAGRPDAGTGGTAPSALVLAAQTAGSFPGVSSAVVAGDHVEVVVDESFPDHELLAHLVSAGVKVRSIGAVRGDLSEVFLRLTKDAG